VVVVFLGCVQESADNCGPEVGLQGKDGLLEEACKKYQAATDLCSTLHEVRGRQGTSHVSDPLSSDELARAHSTAGR